MSICIFASDQVVRVPPTSTTVQLTDAGFANQRLTTDPIFWASITLQNIIVGSKYWIAQSSNLANVIASGTAGATNIIISNCAGYEVPMMITLRVRYSSSTTRYFPLEMNGYLTSNGLTLYISQIEDVVGETGA